MGNQITNKNPTTKMQQQQPVCIDIDKAPASAAPEIKKRLEASRDQSPRQLTKEQIDSKQKHAAEQRRAHVEKQKHQAHEASEKVQLTRERRTSEERASEEKHAAELSTRLQVADEKRNVQIHCIQDKAREHNKRVAKRIEEFEAKQSKECESKRHELDEKLQKAHERHSAQIESVKSIAHSSTQLKTASPKKQTDKAAE